MTQLVYDKLTIHSSIKNNTGGLLCHRKTSSQHDYTMVFLLLSLTGLKILRFNPAPIRLTGSNKQNILQCLFKQIARMWELPWRMETLCFWKNILFFYQIKGKLQSLNCMTTPVYAQIWDLWRWWEGKEVQRLENYQFRTQIDCVLHS